MKFIPNGASLALGRAALKTRKHSPVIMFSVGIAGSVASTVLACRATLKLEEVLQQSEIKKDQIAYAEEHKPEEVYSKKDAENDRRILRVQTVANVAKLYAPAICVGVASIGLLTGSHVVLTKRNTALLAAYGVLERGFNEYRARVRDELGEAKDLEYRYGAVDKEIVEEGEHGHEVKTIRRIDPDAPTSIYARKFEEGNPNWKPFSERNQFFIRCQQDWANDRLQSRGHVFLNEVYDALGLERTREGSVVGWILGGNGDGYIDFGLKDDHQQVADFFSGRVDSVWLDFNVDGTIWDKI